MTATASTISSTKWCRTASRNGGRRSRSPSTGDTGRPGFDPGGLGVKLKKGALFLLAMKCAACKGKIETTFLNKALGTVVKDAKGKKHWFCKDCQKDKGKEELLAKKSKS